MAEYSHRILDIRICFVSRYLYRVHTWWPGGTHAQIHLHAVTHVLLPQRVLAYRTTVGGTHGKAAVLRVLLKLLVQVAKERNKERNYKKEHEKAAAIP